MKMILHCLFALNVCFLLLAVEGCSKDNNPVNNGPSPIDTTGNQPGNTTLPQEWKKAVSYMNGFPDGIEVYQNTTPFNGKNMNAFCVLIDLKNEKIEFKPFLSAANKKPAEIVAEQSDPVYACINAGFFGTNISYSLVQYNHTISALNIKALNRSYNGNSTTYYPTRGAFGISDNGVPEVSWIYHVGSGNGIIYHYPYPSPNALNAAPQPQPSGTFPSGASQWTVKSAVGGSPVLIKNNAINVTDKEELIDINNTTARARSAIGSMADGKLMLLAVEGNNASGGAGLNLQELATLMKGMGCVNALNLDGGGSSSMVVNGKLTIRPSDAGNERDVMSVILIKKK